MYNIRLGTLLGDLKLMKYTEEYVERTKRRQETNTLETDGKQNR